jgi:hypothetical protein
MKKFICSLFLIVSIINVNGQKSVYGFVDLKPVYKYTDSYNWDIFEVTSFGSGSIETLSDNAKSKLLIELFENGFSGKKLIKPLGLNLNNNILNDASKLNTIINDTSCFVSIYNKNIKPIFLSKRKQYSKTFIIRINTNNVLIKLKS